MSWNLPFTTVWTGFGSGGAPQYTNGRVVFVASLVRRYIRYLPRARILFSNDRPEKTAGKKRKLAYHRALSLSIHPPKK